MLTATAILKGTVPYSQSKAVATPRNSDEDFRTWEERIWRERMHVDNDGNVIIPPMSLKNCMAEYAKYRSDNVPGKRNATYTKFFEAGVMVPEPVTLNVKAADVLGEWLFLPADGKRGGGKRVWKCYPCIKQWQGLVTFLILDEMVKPVFEEYLTGAGRFIGIGRFRPRNNGFYGRFIIEDFKWS